MSEAQPHPELHMRQRQRSRGAARKRIGMIPQRPFRSIFVWPLGSARELSRRLGIGVADIARMRRLRLLLPDDDYEIAGFKGDGRPLFIYDIPRIERKWNELARLLRESYRAETPAFLRWWRRESSPQNRPKADRWRPCARRTRPVPMRGPDGRFRCVSR